MAESQRKPQARRAADLPEVRDGRVAVQIWMANPPPDALRRLQALGFELVATLIPGRVDLGTLPVERLEQAAALGFVRRIDTPRYVEAAGSGGGKSSGIRKM
jgi:hypothetical protein